MDKSIWIVGLSGSGKTTVGKELSNKLTKLGHKTFLLDGDEVRSGINNDLGFKESDVCENIRRVSEINKILLKCNIVPINCFICPSEESRAVYKDILGDNIVEIFMDINVDTCIDRDPKGLYKSALSGDINNFAGIHYEYNKPECSDIVIDRVMSVEDEVDTIINFLNHV